MKTLKIIHSDDNTFNNNVTELLMGRKIIEVKKHSDQEGELILDNGIILYVIGNEGCGGCGNGWYNLTELNSCDNIITNVTCENDEEQYNIFVFAENTKINAVQFDGYDNGWYGTGYQLRVMVKEK